MADIHTGGCLCGGVRYKTTGPLRSVIACHCTQCRKTSGHHTAMTSVPRANLILESDETLVWFKSSDIARRGFCGRCGGNLFWEPVGEDRVSIAAGTLDGATGLTIESHIYTEDAGDYYDLPEI
ncbi:MAG: GFA family protein [Candidatus Dadabacteria bacterium]|nr:GFA family protein [Candidatus Dadabacteria bacterium]